MNLHPGSTEHTTSTAETRSASFGINTNTPTPERIARAALELPPHHEPFTDRYFLNTAEILRTLGCAPWVRAQVMIRTGPGIVGGMTEALAVLARYSKIAERGGVIRSLQDGDAYVGGETLMTIEAPISTFVELETMYLGVLSAGTTAASGEHREIDPDEVTRRMNAVTEAAGAVPVIYMGARHWHYRDDPAISLAAFLGGAAECSTDAGAATVGRRGIGTIPHVLENVMAWRHGREHAVVEAAAAFDAVIDGLQRRIALIDYNNREISDAVAVATRLNGALDGVRVDTCGENIAQGAIASADAPEAIALRTTGVPLPLSNHPEAKFWYGRGVTVTGVYALRKALDAAGFNSVSIVLSSGFGDPAKISAFRHAEAILGMKLLDGFGVGGVFDSRSAKMDIVGVGADRGSITPIAKTGRGERPNPRLVERTLP